MTKGGGEFGAGDLELLRQVDAEVAGKLGHHVNCGMVEKGLATLILPRLDTTGAL